MKISPLLKDILKLLTKLIVIIPIGIFILLMILLFTPIYIFRWILFHNASIFQPDLGKMLTTGSTSMILEENLYNDAPNMSMVYLAVLEGSLDFQTTFEMMKNQGVNAKCPKTGQILYPELQQNITTVCGFPFWKQVKSFKLEDHISELEESKLNSIDHDKAFQLMSDLTKKPFTKDRALWEIIHIHNYIPNSKAKYLQDGKNYSGFIFRTHHVLADGFSMIKLIQKTMDTTVIQKVESPKSKIQPNADKSFKEKSKSKIFIAQLLECVQIFCFPITLPYILADIIIEKLFNPFSWDMKDKKSETFSTGHTDLIPVAYIKEIKDRLNVPFNSVVVAGVASCIRQLLASSPAGEKILNGCGSVDIAMPFPKVNHPDKLRNHLKVGVLNLPFRLLREEDPNKRLNTIDNYIQKMKNSTLYIVSNKFGMVMRGALPIWLTRPFVKSSLETHLAFLSNFRAPTLNCFECPVKEIYVSTNNVACTNIFNTIFLTHGEHCRLMISANTAILPTYQDAESLAEEFSKQLEIFKKCGSYSEV